MKVERLGLEKGFKPIEVLLTVETKEELEALREMCGYNITIPQMVRTGSLEVTTFLNELLNKLNKNQ